MSFRETTDQRYRAIPPVLKSGSVEATRLNLGGYR